MDMFIHACEETVYVCEREQMKINNQSMQNWFLAEQAIYRPSKMLTRYQVNCLIQNGGGIIVFYTVQLCWRLFLKFNFKLVTRHNFEDFKNYERRKERKKSKWKREKDKEKDNEERKWKRENERREKIKKNENKRGEKSERRRKMKRRKKWEKENHQVTKNREKKKKLICRLNGRINWVKLSILFNNNEKQEWKKLPMTIFICYINPWTSTMTFLGLWVLISRNLL